MEGYKKIRQNLIHQGKVVGFYEDIITLPNGNTVTWDLVKHPGAAAIIPVTEEGNILLVRQYRNALDAMTFEIPAGGIEKGESGYDCVKREIEEETGRKAEKIELLITIVTAIGFCDEKIPIFVGTGLSKTEQNLDEDEFIDVYEFTLDEVRNMILKGEIVDAKTISGVMTYLNSSV